MANKPKSLLDEIDTNLLYEAPVTPVDATFGLVKPNASQTLPFNKMIEKEQRRGLSDVMVVFAIRHNWQIPWGGSSVAVVKETGVNDEALLTFHQEFFARGPLYKDDQWKIYKAMGGRRLSVLTIFGRIIPFRSRMKAKGIESQQPGQGDFWTQGGMLVFDKSGLLIHAAHDEFGIEFDIVSAKAAIEQHRMTLKPC